MSPFLFICLGLFYQGSQAQLAQVEVHPNNGVNKGVWGTTEICPDNGFVNAVSIKHDGVTSSSADSRINSKSATGLQFYCLAIDVPITSSFDSQGTWYPKRSCPLQFTPTFGIQLNVRPGDIKEVNGTTVVDLLGIQDVRLACEDGTILDGFTGQMEYIKDLRSILENFGDAQESEDLAEYLPRRVRPAKIISAPLLNGLNWGAWAVCDSQYNIGGLRTRIESSDSGLTDVIIICVMDV